MTAGGTPQAFLFFVTPDPPVEGETRDILLSGVFVALRAAAFENIAALAKDLVARVTVVALLFGVAQGGIAAGIGRGGLNPQPDHAPLARRDLDRVMAAGEPRQQRAGRTADRARRAVPEAVGAIRDLPAGQERNVGI